MRCVLSAFTRNECWHVLANGLVVCSQALCTRYLFWTLWTTFLVVIEPFFLGFTLDIWSY
jgi:hypothetical protein